MLNTSSRARLGYKKGSNRLGSIIGFGVSIALVAAAAWLVFNRQAVLDRLSVWSYSPSAAVKAIAQNVQFTDKGRLTFYATQPSVDESAAFNQSCPRQEQGNPILGCYTGTDRIHIFDVTNPQLNGIEEVTAAHETLHAIWKRTSKTGQDKLGVEIKAAYDKLNNPDLKKRMEYYQRTEPGEFINELHSILGTEIPDLGEPLESYYAQFFNRQAVLDQHARYQAVYQNLTNQASGLLDKMQNLSKSIESRSSAYNADAGQLTSDIQTFNSRAQAGGFSSRSQFNNERAALVARSTVLESQRTAINADIQTYNSYIQQYQAIAKQVESLNQSMDSFNEIKQGPSV